MFVIKCRALKHACWFAGTADGLVTGTPALVLTSVIFDAEMFGSQEEAEAAAVEQGLEAHEWEVTEAAIGTSDSLKG
jgi:hypothetical protein